MHLQPPLLELQPDRPPGLQLQCQPWPTDEAPEAIHALSTLTFKTQPPCQLPQEQEDFGRESEQEKGGQEAEADSQS